MTTLRVPDEIAHRYEDLARAAGCEKDDYIRRALIEYLEDIEDAQVVAECLQNPGKRSSLDEVEMRLGLAD